MKYIFVHIGKTGGESFRQLVANNTNIFMGYRTPIEKVCDDIKLKNDSSSFTDSDISFIKGKVSTHNGFSAHMCYGLHNFIDEDYTYLSIIRHPVKRLISQYNYNIQGYGELMKKHYSSFEDFAKKSTKDRMINILYLSGLPCESEALVGWGCPFHSKSTLDEHIETALDNISKDNYIFGFTERYDELLDILKERLNWRVTKIFTNKTKVKSDIPQSEIDAVTNLCEKEIEFHNRALEIYKTKYNK